MSAACEWPSRVLRVRAGGDVFALDVAVPVHGALACVQGAVVVVGACVSALVCVVVLAYLRVHGAGPLVACHGEWRVLLRVPLLDPGIHVRVVALVAVVLLVRLAGVGVSLLPPWTQLAPPAFVSASRHVPLCALSAGRHP